MTKLSGPMLPPRAGGAPEQLIVLLHGYGSDGNDLIALGQVWAPSFPRALFVAPNAPQVCAENSFGFEWFPLDLDRMRSRMEGAREARPVLAQFLADLWAQTGLDASSTVLVGFSQGAMVALHVGLSLKQRLAGIVAFSGALIPPEGFPQPEDVRPPILLIHGDLDSVVNPALSSEADVQLRALGYQVTLHISPGVAHSISPDGLQIATAFLRRVSPR